jgi:hypothetical protein
VHNSRGGCHAGLGRRSWLSNRAVQLLDGTLLSQDADPAKVVPGEAKGSHLQSWSGDWVTYCSASDLSSESVLPSMQGSERSCAMPQTPKCWTAIQTWQLYGLILQFGSVRDLLPLVRAARRCAAGVCVRRATLCLVDICNLRQTVDG